MTNFAAASLALTDSLLFRWLLLLAAICAVIAVAILGLRRLDRWLDERVCQACVDMPWTDEAEWIFDAAEFIDCRTDTATIEHVAAQAAVDLDDEWAQISGGGWSA